MKKYIYSFLSIISIGKLLLSSEDPNILKKRLIRDQELMRTYKPYEVQEPLQILQEDMNRYIEKKAHIEQEISKLYEVIDQNQRSIEQMKIKKYNNPEVENYKQQAIKDLINTNYRIFKTIQKTISEELISDSKILHTRAHRILGRAQMNSIEGEKNLKLKKHNEKIAYAAMQKFQN